MSQQFIIGVGFSGSMRHILDKYQARSIRALMYERLHLEPMIRGHGYDEGYERFEESYMLNPPSDPEAFYNELLSIINDMQEFSHVGIDRRSDVYVAFPALYSGHPVAWKVLTEGHNIIWLDPDNTVGLDVGKAIPSDGVWSNKNGTFVAEFHHDADDHVFYMGAISAEIVQRTLNDERLKPLDTSKYKGYMGMYRFDQTMVLCINMDYCYISPFLRMMGDELIYTSHSNPYESEPSHNTHNGYEVFNPSTNPDTFIKEMKEIIGHLCDVEYIQKQQIYIAFPKESGKYKAAQDRAYSEGYGIILYPNLDMLTLDGEAEYIPWYNVDDDRLEEFQSLEQAFEEGLIIIDSALIEL